MIRRPLSYHPQLGHRLRLLAASSSHAFWMRPGQADQEIFSAYPHEIIRLSDQGLGDTYESHVLVLDSLWRELEATASKYAPAEGLHDMPFRGGLAGYTAYDTNQSIGASPTTYPGSYWGIYLHWILIDHHRQTAEEVSLLAPENIHPSWENLLRQLQEPKPQEENRHFSLSSAFAPQTSKEKYTQDFERIKSYLKEGDCYQVNYAQAFKAGCKGSSAAAMQRLIEISDPAYAAWLSLPAGDVLSLSPELFIQIKDRRIETRPIKGTAPRLTDPDADARQADELHNSTKNRAENLMIVDLLRHDIGQHAEIGSVKVERLFQIESLPQVHHMVSTITATLAEGSTSIDLVRDCFPGGSITGAPKKRAMEIIAELEPTPRSIYCGSIGFINFDGDCLLNIAIRTLLRVDDEIYAWAGGGIVADSDCEAEYQECFDKMGALMHALEAMGKSS